MLVARDFFEAKEKNLHDIFSKSNKFFVPDYQRKYAWTKNQLDQFWEDFIKTHESCYNEYNDLKPSQGQQPHFLGAIVLTILEDDKYEIIDGQQRLTSTCIFIKTLGEIAYRIKDSQKMYNIIRLTEPFIQSNIPGMEFEAKIELDSTINRFFEEYILTCKNKEDRDNYLNGKNIKKNSSQMLIKECYEFFYYKLQEEFPKTMNEQDLYKKLNAYIIILSRYFLVLQIGVKNKNTAYTIFETLNKRGKDLSESDMIKNELFKVLNNVNVNVKSKWDIICDNIDNEDLTEYIRFSYSSQEDNVTPAKLYEKVKLLINNRNAHNYLYNLEAESRLYGYIMNIDTNYWISYAGKEKGQNIIDNLNALKSMDITNSTPIILSSAVRFITNENDVDSFDKTLSYIVTFCFRYFTIGGNTVASFEKEIGGMARAIRDSNKTIKKGSNEYRIETLDDIKKYMELMTPDIVFKKNFKEFSTKSMPLAFYIIYNLEKHLKSGVQPLPHGPKQHIEHIMPKNPSNRKNRLHEWSHVRNKAEYNEYIHRLGNLMILESEINSAIKNKDFIEKLNKYQDSNLYYPDLIVQNYSKWDFNSIENRQEFMSNTALKIWNYK
ncbi:hypothetical protein VN21_15295 [Paraclostridium benzoelyticum]|uniref:DUF262 domain-containing protein n=1 Tax=Paraclostridium benzoelyticum TaxID=1629550 RepID=A0A0M3DC36_9FIRM|nr:DUF262 domain-containing protein [Paraclostridium benzoelyticum]KKY00230.1 hypothetical protein VN21_15295 [Paraclostridium benzoelyticum]